MVMPLFFVTTGTDGDVIIFEVEFMVLPLLFLLFVTNPPAFAGDMLLLFWLVLPFLCLVLVGVHVPFMVFH